MPVQENVISAPAPASQAPSGGIPGVKPGYQSTEFWIFVIVIAFNICGALAQILPPAEAAKFSLAGAAIYNLLRFVLKMQHAAGFSQVTGTDSDLLDTLGAEAFGPLAANAAKPSSAAAEPVTAIPGTVNAPPEIAPGLRPPQQVT